MGLIQSKQGAATASPLSITLDNPTTAGHGLVVMITASGTTANGTVSGITLGGAAGNFASAASAGGSADASITACWLDLNCAGGQTAVSISFTGGSGTQQFFAAVYERDDLLTASAFDKSAGNISTVAWTSNATAATTQATEVAVGAVFITGSSQPTITGPASPWNNLTVQTATQGSFLDAWLSSWKPLSATGAVTYSGTSTNGTDGTALVVTLKATASAPPDIPQVSPGPSWLRWFKPGLSRARPPAPPPGPGAVTSTGSLGLASLAFAGQAAQGVQASDAPQVSPGPLWLRLFKPWMQRPVPPAPAVQAVNGTGSFSLAPLAFSGTAGQSSPGQPQAQPGPFWLRLFRPQSPRPLPPAPAVQSVSGTGSLALAPLAFSGTAAQTSPDQPQVSPGPLWLRLFKPQVPRPLPPPPAQGTVAATGSLSLAPLAFTASGGQSSPDVPQITPGPSWFRLFKPWAQRPVPPPPAVQNVTVAGSLGLAPLTFTGQSGQTAPDQPQVSPGATWLDLFRPWAARPRPFTPAQPPAGVTSTGSFTLAPVALSGSGAQTSPDAPQVSPGPLWLRLFRPWQQRPVPPPPAVQGVTANGSFSVAPIAFSANAGQTSPDIPQAQPGPFWLRLFRPQVPKPVPPPPALPAVSASGSFALAPLAFTAAGAQTSPDVPQVQPGPMWLRLLRPQVRRPLPPPPALQPVTSAGSLTLAPLAFTGSGTPPVQDQPQVSPGPLWLRFFKPWVPRPVPPVPPPWQPPPATASGSLALAPLAVTAQAGQSSPDIPQAQPGPLWLRLFRPWLRRPLPPVPAVQGITSSGNLALAPLALSAQAAQTAPDQPQAQPGPAWLRFFRPWLQKPVPPVPAIPAVNATGSLAVAPLALSGTGTVTGGTAQDQPQAQPGPVWQRLFRPWIPKRVPPPPQRAVPGIQCSGSVALAPVALSGTAGIVPPPLFTLGIPYLRWDTGTPAFRWAAGTPGIPEWQLTAGTPYLQWDTSLPASQWTAGTPVTST